MLKKEKRPSAKCGILTTVRHQGVSATVSEFINASDEEQDDFFGLSTREKNYKDFVTE